MRLIFEGIFFGFCQVGYFSLLGGQPWRQLLQLQGGGGAAPGEAAGAGVHRKVSLHRLRSGQTHISKVCYIHHTECQRSLLCDVIVLLLLFTM